MDFADANVISEHACSIGASIVGLTETNVDWKHRDCYHQCRSIFQRYWTRIGMTTSSSDWRFGRVYQPGGTATIVGSPWAGRTKTHNDTSGLGRWSISYLTGRCNSRVAIITAYRATGNKHKGPFTAFSQQQSILRERDIEIAPDELFYRDLGSLVKKLKEDSYSVILMMDANDSMERTSSRLNKWTRDCELLDPHTYLHGVENQPATFIGGSTRIDYILVTPDIIHYINKAGILPFNGYYESDHRALFIDIDLHRVLRGMPHDPIARDQRAISSKIPWKVEKYQKFLHKACTESNIFSRAKQFEEKYAHTQLTPSLHQELEQIDAELTAIQLEAERLCRAKRHYPWSPLLKECNNRIRYWRLWIREIRRHKDYGAARAAIEVTFDLPTAIPTIREAKNQLRQALQAIYAVQKNAESHRFEFLENRASFLSANGEGPTASIVKRIKYTETKNQIFTHLRWISGKCPPPPLSYLIKENDGDVQVIVGSDEIEAELFQRNISHFSQSDATPFAKGEFQNLFGKYGTNDLSQSILQGEPLDAKFTSSESTRIFFETLQKQCAIDAIQGTVNGMDLQGGYKIWNEGTSTSPSGLHLGHYKATLHKIIRNDETSFTDDFFDHIARMINLAIKHRHVYSRWKTVITTMIEKIPGTPRIDKLRVIHIIESDFNLWMGIVCGRRMIYQAEDMEVFGEEQSGSRPGKKCQDVVIFKHMIYSILRLTKTDGITFDNDAKSCFDRIVLVVASLITQRLGMSQDTLELFIETLSSVKYYAKTYYGLSQLPYYSTDEYNIHGPGQGGRASPAIWTAISCFLLQCMRENTIGATLISPFGSRIHQVSSGFVDDITHWCIQMDQPNHSATAKQLKDHMQHTAQLWEQLLFLTGGKLELSKCFYYPIMWTFDNEGKASMIPPSQLSNNIHMTDSESSQQFEIEAKPCDTAHKTLGVMEQPDGGNKAEYERLIKKAQRHTQILASSILKYEETETYYFAIYVPSMSYSLVVGTLTEKQSHTIQSPVTQIVLTGLGYHSRTPLEVVYGPPSLGGLGLRHIFSEQGSLKAQALIQQIRIDSKLGKLMIMQLQWAQLLCGAATPLLEDTSTEWPMLSEELWITSLRDFLKKSEISICIPRVHPVKLQREGDQYLMDLVQPLEFRRGKILQIHRCRIYLRVILLSDICNATGTKISTSVYNCLETYRERSSIKWPRQDYPGPAAVRTWKKFLRFLCKDDSLDLRNPLGPWYLMPRLRAWDGYYIPRRKILLTVDRQNHPIQFNQHISGRKVWTMRYPSRVDDDWRDLWNEGIPIDVLEYCDDECRISAPVMKTQKPNRIPRSWDEYISGLPECSKNVLQTMQVNVQCPIWLFPNDEKNPITIVSDGSVRDDRGTYAWVVSTPGNVLITGSGPVFGSEISSFRSELFGIWAWTLYLWHYSTFLQVDIPGTIQPYCDNISAVKRLNETDFNNPQDSMLSDYDIVAEACLLLANLREKIPIAPIAHVKGHQDRHTAIQALPWEAQMNIEADRLANGAMDTWTQLPNVPTHHNPVYVKAGDRPIQSNELHTLRWRWREIQLQDYYARNLKISTTSLHTINWAALRMARGRMRLKMRQFSLKLSINWLATGTQLEKYGSTSKYCHLCNEPETNVHLFTCPNRKCVRDKFFESLRKRYEKSPVELRMTNEIISALVNWIENRTDSNIPEHLMHQSTIGWELFIRGFQSVNIARHYDKNNVEKKRIGDSWQADVCYCVTEALYDIWKERNQQIHQINPETEKTRAQEEVISQVKYLYGMKNQMSVNDANEIFSLPLDRRLLLSIESNKEWIRQNRTYINKRIQQWKDRARNHLQDIRKFFSQKKIIKIRMTTVNDSKDHTQRN